MSEDELQMVIIMVGNVGSGKSTYVSEMFSDFVRISQDLLGSREECEKLMRQSLSEGKCVVVDRVNFNKKQRKVWLDIAREFKVEAHAIYLEVPTDICLERIESRKGHETITEDMTKEKKADIVFNFDKQMQEPTLYEGFKSVCLLRNYE